MNSILLSANRTASLIQDGGVRIDTYDADGRRVGWLCLSLADVTRLHEMTNQKREGHAGREGK